jgi:hypothetical protein
MGSLINNADLEVLEGCKPSLQKTNSVFRASADHGDMIVELSIFGHVSLWFV